MKPSVTIRDVAHAAGVSIQTVSNVMHGKSSVRADIQARVLDVIERLSYYPSQAAQGLRQRASHTLGFLVFDPNPRALADPVHGEVIAGMCDVARDHAYNILVDTPLIRPDAPAEHFLRLFRTRRIDAAVITLSGRVDGHDEVIRQLVEAEILFAILEREVVGEQVYCLLGANYAGAYAATRTLIERGHTAIAFIDSLQMWPAVDQRLRGYIGAMEAHGLGNGVRLVSSIDWSADGGAAAMGRLIEDPTDVRPTAVLAGNDLLAIGAMHTIRAAGLHIPDDIAVIGFDDFEFTRYVEPTLSSVRLPSYDMGRQAAQLLIQHLRGEPTTDRRYMLPTELILRQSV